MKTSNKKKIVVSTLALAMGAALAGSISGSVAWYQYSTRSVAEFTGAAAHCTENLQIRVRLDKVVGDDNKVYTFDASAGEWDAGEAIDTTFVDQAAYDAGFTGLAEGAYFLFNSKAYQKVGGAAVEQNKTSSANRTALVNSLKWHSDLRADEISAYLTNTGRDSANELKPVTSKGDFDGTTGVASVLYREPVYQDKNNTWRQATANDYINLPLELRVLDVNGANPEETLAQPIHVTNVEMAAARGSVDVSNALRLGISSSVGSAALVGKATLSKEDLSAGIKSFGALDLNVDGKLDTTNDYSWQSGEVILYGTTLTYLPVVENDLVKYSDAYFTVGAAGDSFVHTPATVTTYADLAERDAVVSPANGALCVVLGKYYKYNGSAWVDQVCKEATSGLFGQGTKFFDATDSYNEKDFTEDEYLIKSKRASTFISTETTVGTITTNTGLLGTTTTTENLNVDLKIYLEGWQDLGALSENGVWKTDVLGAQFNLGIRFSTTLHDDNHD